MKVSLTPRSLLPNQNNEISALCVRVPGEDLKPCPSALIHPFASEIKHVLTLACKQSYNYNVHTCTSSGHIPLLIIPLSSTCPILSKYAFDYIKQCRLLCCFFCYSFVFACVWVCVSVCLLYSQGPKAETQLYLWLQADLLEPNCRTVQVWEAFSSLNLSYQVKFKIRLWWE